MQGFQIQVITVVNIFDESMEILKIEVIEMVINFSKQKCSFRLTL